MTKPLSASVEVVELHEAVGLAGVVGPEQGVLGHIVIDIRLYLL